MCRELCQGLGVSLPPWQWPGVVCVPPMEERIWQGLGFFSPDYEHVGARLPQSEVFLEEVHDQRALPINVEEVRSHLRDFAGGVRLSRKEGEKK